MKSKLEVAFSAAAAKGHKSPTLRANGLRFKRAPDSGRNAGAIYVTQHSEYLGKIKDNLFTSVFKVHHTILSIINEVMDNPQEVAIAFGRRTGNCAICGRHLDNKESVKLGIGPICAENMGWVGFTDLIDDDNEPL